MKFIKLRKLVRKYLFPTKATGKNNSVCIHKTTAKNNVIISVYGDNNSISIDKDCILTNVSIVLIGNNNSLSIGANTKISGPSRILLEGNSTLAISENCGIRTSEILLRDANISIGEKCMFAHGIKIRNHDSHKIYDKESQLVQNQPKDIHIGRHVWLGENCTILKGVKIGDDSIIATGAIVTKGCECGCILAGNPAKIIKENITWDY